MACYKSSKMLLYHYNHELLSLQEEPGISKINVENVKIKFWLTWDSLGKGKSEKRIENWELDKSYMPKRGKKSKHGGPQYNNDASLKGVQNPRPRWMEKLCH